MLKLLLLLFMLLLGLTLYQPMRPHLICTEMVPWNSGESRVMGSLVLTGTGLLTSESPASTCSLKRARYQQLMACSLAPPPQFGPDCCCRRKEQPLLHQLNINVSRITPLLRCCSSLLRP